MSENQHNNNNEYIAHTHWQRMNETLRTESLQAIVFTETDARRDRRRHVDAYAARVDRTR